MRTIVMTAMTVMAVFFVGCGSSSDGGESSSKIMLTGVPDVRQAEYYSCGAAAFQAILSYYGISSFETDLRTMLKTSSTHGTYSWDMVDLAKQLGFDAEWKEDVSLADVEFALAQGIPVITRSQPMKDPSDTRWENEWGVGHYMVVFGMDPQNVYLEDPYLIGLRRVMSRDDFIASWHSYDTEVPIPPDARKVYHEAVFIRGTPPASRPEFSDYDRVDWPPLLQPVVVEPWKIEPPPCSSDWPHCRGKN